MILHLYFAKRFVISFAIVASAFLVLIIMIDFIEHLRNFRGQDVAFIKILELVALNVPASLHQTLPLIIILCSIMLFLGLSKSNELVVTRAAGRSAIRLLIGPIIAAFSIGVISIIVLNPIVAGTKKQYENLTSELSNLPINTSYLSANGLWLRQGTNQIQTVIHAIHANLDGTKLFKVTLQDFDLSGTAIRRIVAQSASLEQGHWNLINAKEWPLKLAQNPEANALSKSSYKIPTELTRDQIQDSFATPASIPIWKLPAFIHQLKKAGFSAKRHIVWFHMEITLPLFLSAMVMIGAGCTMRHTRQRRTKLMVLMAILFGFSLYFLRNFAQILGENGQLPEVWTAWIPPIAAIGLSLAFLLHTEDG
jgi:lipopolysaccharide export system permease protein